MSDNRRGPTVAATRDDDHFIERHETFLKMIREQKIDVLFLGDSITRRWNDNPEQQRHWFGDLNAANFGVGGDAIENLLWRIRNGELEGFSPRVVVLLIGTNNLPQDDGDSVAEGIELVVREIRARVPAAKLLLMGILPRGPRTPATATEEQPYYRDTINGVNRRIERLAADPAIRYLSAGEIFLDDDGSINEELMPDQLHPVAAGYEKLGAVLRPVIDELLAD
ncbi:MAG: GDSL-type esterase/lipase family protein [Spirochaetota bacterium]